MSAFLDARFLISFILISGVIFVNGWTDAPNAVATCIASGACSQKKAVAISAVFNLLGIVVIYAVNDSVSENILSSVSLGNERRLTVLCAAMISIVLFSVFAWYFGIPTSEGHALMAALSGAAVAVGERGVSGRLWAVLGVGIVITTALGFLLGLSLFRWLSRSALANKRAFLRRAQVFSAAALSFMHGAQDGQKFAAVLILGTSLAGMTAPVLPAVICCGVLLSLGTAVGGGRIIEKVGKGITKIDELGGLCCDISAFVSMAVCTACGIPVSTTHSKTTAVLGVGVGRGMVRLGTWGGMAAVWLITFPACFLLSFFITKLCT